MKHNMKYDSMPRAELIAEIEAWESKFDKKVNERVGESTAEREAELDILIDNFANKAVSEVLLEYAGYFSDIFDYPDFLNFKERKLFRARRSFLATDYNSIKYHIKEMKRLLEKNK